MPCHDVLSLDWDVEIPEFARENHGKQYAMRMYCAWEYGLVIYDPTKRVRSALSRFGTAAW